jgi:hypothetical protein
VDNADGLRAEFEDTSEVVSILADMNNAQVGGIPVTIDANSNDLGDDAMNLNIDCNQNE